RAARPVAHVLPPPPPVLSNKGGCPSPLLRFGRRRRATMSVVPPMANGTMIVIGLVGHSCPSTGKAANAESAATVRLRKEFFMIPFLSVESVFADLLLVQLDTETGSVRKPDLTATEIELLGDDVVGRLERTDTFEPG